MKTFHFGNGWENGYWLIVVNDSELQYWFGVELRWCDVVLPSCCLVFGVGDVRLGMK